MSSTTHITEWLRFSLAQISQRYVRNVVARGTEFHFAAQLCQGFRQKRRLLFGLFEQVQHSRVLCASRFRVIATFHARRAPIISKKIPWRKGN
jgi:hypothetical protein